MGDSGERAHPKADRGRRRMSATWAWMGHLIVVSGRNSTPRSGIVRIPQSVSVEEMVADKEAF